MDTKGSEYEPLIKNRTSSPSYTGDDDVSNKELEKSDDEVRLKRHITLPYAVAIIVGNVIGSGIFLSPKGVTQNIGSVGGSLIIWGVTGLYNLAQALCYAELGCVIPRSGGDYAYLFYTLGPLPAFMCAWIHVVIIASSSCAVIARTAALYLIEPLGLQCHVNLITFLAVFIIITLATINGLSAKWATRVHTLFTVAKVLALAIIVVAGVIQLAEGNTQNFENAFEGTSQDPGKVALSILDGYFAYKGWELINALPEEMVNPKRDLPRAVWISMLLVTAIYVLTNMAYFSVLTPAELLQSDAVALTFANRAMGKFALIVPIAVFLSCSGTVNGDFLSNSRYLFAGGRFHQVPQVFSFIHIRLFTPIPAIAALCVFALTYTLFTDLQVMQEYASLSVQAKMLLVLTALFYLRWKYPKAERPVKVNIVVVVLTFLIMIGLVVLSFYQKPSTTGIGVAMYVLGVPLYFIGKFAYFSPTANRIMDKVTVVLQKVLLLTPESKISDDSTEVDFR